MDGLTVHQVFTPGTQAKENFVPRPDVNDHLVDSLQTPGMQVIVFGESGSGKSTLLQRKLEELYEDHITTRCSAAMTYDQVLLNAFDQLDAYYVSATSGSETSTTTGGLAAEFLRVRASLSAQRQNENATEESRVLPPQLTAQTLGQFLGDRGLCWVIEDFHKIPDEQKLPLSQSLKIFSDMAAEYPSLRIVAVGATDTAREVVQYDREMANRVSEVHVPLMTRDELQAILRNGESLLGIDLSEVADRIVDYSVGMAAVCHSLGLNICLEAGVTATQPSTVQLSSENLESAVARWVRDSSDTLKALFDMAMKRHKVRQYDNCRIILTALATGPLEGMTHNATLVEIQSTYPEYPGGNLTKYLRELQGDERGNILRHTGDKFRFREPLAHSFAQAILAPPVSVPTSDMVFNLDVSSLVLKTFKSKDWSYSYPAVTPAINWAIDPDEGGTDHLQWISPSEKDS